MVNIIVFGGHGKIALLTEPILVGKGDTVTAVIRNPDQIAAVEETGAKALVADIGKLNVEGLSKLITGHDAVVWAAGAGGGSVERTYAVDRDAAIRAMDASEVAGVKRFVMVSYFGASIEHGVDPDNSFFAYAEAKGAADRHLRSTTLDWTILGPSALTLDEATGRIDTAAQEAAEVSRANVAQVIAATLVDDTTIHQTICFNDGDTVISQALTQTR